MHHSKMCLFDMKIIFSQMQLIRAKLISSKKLFLVLKGRIHLLLLETNSYQVQKGHLRNLHIFTFPQFGALRILKLSPLSYHFSTNVLLFVENSV